MKKILIIGSCGAGKSTLAKQISERLNLPLIGLDQLYWKPGWVRSEKEEWRRVVADLVLGDEWVMEGNYKSTFDLRFPACDTVIWIELNRFVCFWRMWKRHLLKNRIDKIDKCPEKIDFELMKWVLLDYPRQSRKVTEEFLEKYKKNVIRLRSRRDVICFLKEL